MVGHVVFFAMKEEANGAKAQDNAKLLAERYDAIAKEIAGVVSSECGFNYNNEEKFYHLCLNQHFESRKALEDYLAHPLHQEVREVVMQVIDHRMVVDYDI